MTIDFLIDIFENHRDQEAIIWKNRSYDYAWILDRFQFWRDKIESDKVDVGSVVVIEGDFSPNTIALFLALIERRCIIVPLTNSVQEKKNEYIDVAKVEFAYFIDTNDDVTFSQVQNKPDHPIIINMKKREIPGLVLFSSGSSGASKAVVHDMTCILNKFKVPRQKCKAITFLLYDHIGGVNTMLYQLSNAGCIVTVEGRDPDSVLAAVEKYNVELLPTSPTFINLILLCEAYKRYDISSLKTVSYGTEPMAESTLKRFHELFPRIRMQQTYGLSEIGILRSKSRSSDSLWVKLGGEDFKTRIVNGILQIKAKSAMLGYLNEQNPFTDDGWLDTGDAVEADGEYFRVLGRQSELINVGGQKVYPVEIESCLQEMKNVAEAVVYGEKNPILGQIVCAIVSLEAEEDAKAFRKRLKQFCIRKLDKYKIPVKIDIRRGGLHSGRFKKLRTQLKADVESEAMPII